MIRLHNFLRNMASDEFSASAAHWYALVVKPRIEKHIAEVLAGRGFEVFLPTRPVVRVRGSRKVTVDTPLFSTYVFARFRWAQRLEVLKSPGVRSIVTVGGWPAPVKPQEIESLQIAVRSRVAINPWEFVAEGATVVITRGPLRGVEGRLVKARSSCRLVLNVEILKRAVAVEIGYEDAEPMESSSHPAEFRASGYPLQRPNP